jgi:ATP-binding protein involved in chromosome partitioning
MPVTKDDVLAALGKVAAPDGTPLPKTATLSDIVATDGKVFFSITVDAGVVQAWEPVRKRAEEAVKAMPGVQSAMVALTAERKGGPAPAARPPQGAAPGGAGRAAHTHGHGQAQGPSGVPGVTSIIAVASGKGGVGKSTTAVNLALGLRDLGMKVGILDADIYGPSLPKLLAIREKPQTIGGTRLKPIERYGLTVMSIGFLIEEETPMIWRGPMVMSALTQMLREVEWGTLDVMVVDMPPGTGDAQLTMAQQVPLKGAVIVSTPQDLALIDARRGIAMFKRVNVPVLGIVENMSTFICPNCGTRSTSSATAARATRRNGWACRSWAKSHWKCRSAKPRTLACRLSRPSPTAPARRPTGPSPRKSATSSARPGRPRSAPKIVIEA